VRVKLRLLDCRGVQRWVTEHTEEWMVVHGGGARAMLTTTKLRFGGVASTVSGRQAANWVGGVKEEGDVTTVEGGGDVCSRLKK
jgi:hypothetical protein